MNTIKNDWNKACEQFEVLLKGTKSYVSNKEGDLPKSKEYKYLIADLVEAASVNLLNKSKPKENEWVCPSCGADLDDFQDTCTKCGQEIDWAAAELEEGCHPKVEVTGFQVCGSDRSSRWSYQGFNVDDLFTIINKLNRNQNVSIYAKYKTDHCHHSSCLVYKEGLASRFKQVRKITKLILKNKLENPIENSFTPFGEVMIVDRNTVWEALQ